MTTSIPAGAVVRVSRGDFDPARIAEVETMTEQTGAYLVPAIAKLDGLIAYYAAASPDGSIVHISIWRSDQHAQQMSRLKEMIVDARAAAEAAGIQFTPIVNYQINWSI